ncbi:hypothetical protein J5N97_020843 [Dioscorea zingiberensis]|uniref:Transmembrane protein n=1 Tax=Dioscorea zingiberensis TaxID=325984 RepID=A0A9D5CHC5_9LILI|nr:hypothetical protein J5N97_020843 [Dioscorea zingiberensis]
MHVPHACVPATCLIAEAGIWHSEPRWSEKGIDYVLLCSLPVFIMQLIIILFGPKFVDQKSDLKTFVANCVGAKVVSLVINKGLRRRVYLLIVSVLFLLPTRVLLLASSVLPPKGHLFFEALVFVSFFSVLLCVLIGISILVYFPIADSLALGDLRHIAMEDMPYDNYFRDGVSLVTQQSHQVTWRNPDSLAKHVSISFHPVLKNEHLASGSEAFNLAPSK